jgi:hypothetical protein
LRWKPGCTKLLRLRGGEGWKTVAEKDISGCLSCHLDRIFCNEHFILNTRACAFACIPHFCVEGTNVSKKSCTKRKRNLLTVPSPHPHPASVSISDINKTDIFFLYSFTVHVGITHVKKPTHALLLTFKKLASYI